ncbi:brachyurin-like isoform X2 [Zophobas morio]|uniref:brachyurin-like isoform X2 n=1 Tax=Zophobas morio TaxID=2755281 RepID=UPI00308330DD
MNSYSLGFLLILIILPKYDGKNVNQRIIGGDVAFAGQFPFIAAIYKSTSDGTFFCGGALMNNQWILTSGSCVDGAILFTIYLGAHDLTANEPTAEKLAADTYILHPDYNPNTLENDIGLIKLRAPVTFTMYIKPVDFLPNYELVPNTAGIMTMGWGQLDDDTPGIVDELHYVHLTPISNEECQLTFGNQILDTMVCAAGRYNEGFCRGDSGTPLVRFSNGPRTTHVAIASFISTNGCETPEPSGYTRTYEYVDWIRNVQHPLGSR